MNHSLELFEDISVSKNKEIKMIFTQYGISSPICFFLIKGINDIQLFSYAESY